MSYHILHFDAKLSIATTSIAAWNALMRADPIFGRYALTDAGRSTFLSAFTVVEGNDCKVGGKLHRINGPARTWSDGAEWFEHGELHRIGGPACTYANGAEEWYEHGRRHRIGGPASIWYDGTEVWYEHGELHRIGGPARTFADGEEEWFERGIRIDQNSALFLCPS